jgi:hypothetical protein
MNRYVKMIGRGIKYAGITLVGGLTLSFGYLQYINSQIGGIVIDKDDLVEYYKTNLKMGEG